MRKIALVLSLTFCLSIAGACISLAANQAQWLKPAHEALQKAYGEIGKAAQPSDLLVLSNAAYGQAGGHSAAAFIGSLQEVTGCGLGSGNLALVHSSLLDPLWFALYRKDSKKLIFAKWTGSGFDQQTLDARPEKLLTREGWKKAAKGLIGPNSFSVVSISLTWAVGPPWPLFMAACFHDHFCPGVNGGYIAGQYAMDKLPLGPGDKYAFVTAPAKCAADALQVMFNTTSGKSAGFSMNPTGKSLKKYASGGVVPMTVAMRINAKKDVCSGLVLGMDWKKAYVLTGVKADEMAPAGGKKDPIFWIARVKMSREMARLPKDKLMQLIVPLKSFSGPAKLAARIASGDPYAAVMNK
jgi:formylmethanofuran dehydrogenase subunit E-like metal-binding protein